MFLAWSPKSHEHKPTKPNNFVVHINSDVIQKAELINPVIEWHHLNHFCLVSITITYSICATLFFHVMILKVAQFIYLKWLRQHS